MIIARGRIASTLHIVNKRLDSIRVADQEVHRGLWHHRLANMSKKDLPSLLIRGMLPS